jgi:GNAT superfamily N-acetyltransferase
MQYEITGGYIPGVIGKVTEMHATYYYQHWGFNDYFETKTGLELVAFMKSFNPQCDGIWTAVIDDRIVGSVAIVGAEASTKGARLRWFIVEQEYRGHGIGKSLMRRAIDFCRKAGFPRVYLTTFTGLDAARHLYEQNGFKLVEEQEDCNWGKTVLEQKFELNL